MSIPNAASAYRTLSRSLRRQSARNVLHTTRGTSPRHFSNSAVAYVNLTRPTTRTSTTSTTTTAKAPPAPTPPTPAKTAPPAATPTKPPPSQSPPPPTQQPTQRSLSSGLSDTLPLPTASPLNSTGDSTDWSRSFHGLSSTPFDASAAEALMAPLDPSDVEIKPDGIIYLPEIKYRRILNRAFGPGGWGLAPRGETIVTGRSVTREYGLVVHGRLVSIARGEQQYFDPEGIPTATEGCKSNALMRCCKDLGIASELWDPVFIRKFKATHGKEMWVEHVTTKRKRKIYMRKDVNEVPGGYKAT